VVCNIPTNTTILDRSPGPIVTPEIDERPGTVGKPHSSSQSHEWQLPPGAPQPAIAPFDAAAAKKHQQAWAEYLGQPAEQDIDLAGGARMRFVLIPPGEFLMGSTEEEQARFLEEAKAADDKWTVDRIPSEQPQHRVRITKPYRLSGHEVTLGQFRQFVEETGYKTEAERDGTGGYGSVDGNLVQDLRFVWNADLGFPQTDDHPVVNVSWNDAMAFCQWLSKRQGIAYDLPTEAQWEYACRAGTTTSWHCGDSDTTLQEYAWFETNSGLKTHPVRQLKPNAWGLYDVHGNAWEWCADWHGADYYAQALPSDPSGPGTGAYRVFRGGSWHGHAGGCRSAFRYDRSPDHRNHNLGFRVISVLGDEKVGVEGADQAGVKTPTVRAHSPDGPSKPSVGPEAKDAAMSEPPADADNDLPLPIPLERRFGLEREETRLPEVIALDLLDHKNLAIVMGWGMVDRVDLVSGDSTILFSKMVPQRVFQCMSLSPDRRYIACGLSDGTLQLRDLEKQSLLWEVPAHRDRVGTVVFSSDGKRILTVSYDSSVRVWDTATGKQLAEMDVGRQCYVAAFLPDEIGVILGGAGSPLDLWDVESGVKLREFCCGSLGNNFARPLILDDGRQMLSSPASENPLIYLWDVSSAKPLRTYVGHTDDVKCLKLLPDGRHFISGSADRTLRIWSLEHRRELYRGQDPTARTDCVAVTSDGKYAVTGGREYSEDAEWGLFLWRLPDLAADVETGETQTEDRKPKTYPPSATPAARTSPP